MNDQTSYYKKKKKEKKEEATRQNRREIQFHTLLHNSYYTQKKKKEKEKEKEKEKGYVYNIFVTNFKWLVVTRCY